MKIVINDCYGGFGLSHEAIMRYAEIKGIKLYAWNDSQETSHYTTVPKDEFNKIWERDKEKTASMGGFDESNAVYFNDYDIKANDPALIQVIEELGTTANGQGAKLKIVNIPEGVKWHIEDHNGFERVAEDYRVWE